MEGLRLLKSDRIARETKEPGKSSTKEGGDSQTGRQRGRLYMPTHQEPPRNIPSYGYRLHEPSSHLTEGQPRVKDDVNKWDQTKPTGPALRPEEYFQMPSSAYDSAEGRWEAPLRRLQPKQRESREAARRRRRAAEGWGTPGGGGAAALADGRPPPAHAPHSYRENTQDLMGWIDHCSRMMNERGVRDRRGQKERELVAAAFYCLSLLRRWRRWAALRRHVRPALRRWLHRPHFDKWRAWARAARLVEAALRRALNLKLALAWRRWLEYIEMVKTMIAQQHYRAVLLRKACAGWRRFLAGARALALLSGAARLRGLFRRWRRWLQLWLLWKAAARRVIMYWYHGNLFEGFMRWKLLTERLRAIEAWSSDCWWPILRKLVWVKYFRAWQEFWGQCRAARILLRAFYLGKVALAWLRWRRLPRPKPPSLPEPLPPPPVKEEDTGRSKRTRKVVRVRDGRGRQGHCRCVYDVSKGGRCECQKASHLLRRIEMLHELAANALTTANASGHERKGGNQGSRNLGTGTHYRRILSHVVEYGDDSPIIQRRVMEVEVKQRKGEEEKDDVFSSSAAGTIRTKLRRNKNLPPSSNKGQQVESSSPEALSRTKKTKKGRENSLRHSMSRW